jgi:KaiC/GvpD/RAD55 family RecA-like ATPase
MGRTAPTYRLLTESEIQKWNMFRKALTRRDREAFDELMKKVRKHVSASSYMGALDVFDSMSMAILLEHEIEILKLKKKIEYVSD